MWLQWNRAGGTGNCQSFIANQKGLGTGGISFGETTTANVYTQNMFLGALGNLTTVGNITVNGQLSTISNILHVTTLRLYVNGTV